MAIEKERKFKLKSGKLPEGLPTPIYIEQGYLMKGENNHLRVRLTNGYLGMVAYKHDINQEERFEFEFGCQKQDAIQLLELCQYKVGKLRYKTKFADYSVDIDVYVSANGVLMDRLAVVEIEFEKELEVIPDYCGDEITGVKRYSNINLAMNGYRRSQATELIK